MTGAQLSALPPQQTRCWAEENTAAALMEHMLLDFRTFIVAAYAVIFSTFAVAVSPHTELCRKQIRVRKT